MIFEKPPLSIGDTKTASYTAVIGELNLIDLSTSAADITVTFPSSPSAGDQFGFTVIGVNASGGSSTVYDSRPFYSVEPANATSINGSSYTSRAGSDGGGKFSLWIVGESSVYMYSGSTWLLITDGRVPHSCKPYLTGTQSVTTGTAPYVTLNGSYLDNVGMHNTSTNNSYVRPKRQSSYSLTAMQLWASNGTGERQMVVSDASIIPIRTRLAAHGLDNICGANITAVMTPGSATYFRMTGYQDSGGNLNMTATTGMSVTEILG